LQRASVTHMNRRPLLAAIIASATPKFPDEDSTKVDSGLSSPLFGGLHHLAGSLELHEPAKLKPSHFRNSDRPKIG
jgi:hypothetical protein